MRDLHFIKSGPKKYFELFEDADEAVRRLYPTATREGSLAAWSWNVGDTIVAEAWLHTRKNGWWMRVLSTRATQKGDC